MEKKLKYCKEQLKSFLFMPHATSVCAPFVAVHTSHIRLCDKPKHATIVVDLQVPEVKPNVFQDDRIKLHIHNEMTRFFNRQLSELCFGEGRSTSWPPRSPDLTPFSLPCRAFWKTTFTFRQCLLPWTTWRNEYRGLQKLNNFYAKHVSLSQITYGCVQGVKWSTGLYLLCLNRV
jgi:hypothetical protein